MNPGKIYYEEGYKYQVYYDLELVTPILGFNVSLPFIDLYADGLLRLRKGFAWDGASGLTIDTKSSQKGSAGHDAFFRLLRAGLLPHSPCFRLANEFLRDQCKRDGMWGWRANAWFRAVERFGNAHAALQPDKVFTAP